MNFNEYQELAERTSGMKEADLYSRLLVSAVALAGEVGELCNIIKKVVAHGHDLDLDQIADELGDPMWYIAEICSALGLTMEEVAERNIGKLRLRYPDGFSEEASRNRKV